MPSSFGGQSQQRWGHNTVSTQESMRDVQMMDTAGKVCATGDARKKGMLLLVFFRTDEPASAQLLPWIQKIADAYKESGKLTVWGVSPNGGEATMAYAKAESIGFPVLLDYDGYHTMLYGITTLPTVFLANGGGGIERKFTGFRRDALADVSARVATFAGVEPVDIFNPAPVVEPAAEPTAEPTLA